MLPVLKQFEDAGLEFTFIASGQNDIGKSVVWKIMKKKKPDIILFNGHLERSASGLFLWAIKTFLRSFPTMRKELIKSDRKDNIMIVQGDTVSTIMGALFGKLFHAKVAHVEAGYRSNHLFQPFPEEIDRTIVSLLTDVHFCAYKELLENIKNKRGLKINTHYNTKFEAIQYGLKANTDITSLNLPSRYYICILHRQENLFNRKFTTAVVKAVAENTKVIPCLFIEHSLTRHFLSKYRLLELIGKNQKIIQFTKQPFYTFLQILIRAEFIITDGGGNQQEASYLGIPCLLLRNVTEGNEGLGRNILLLKGDFSRLTSFMNNYQDFRTKPIVQKYSPSKIIFDTLTSAKLP